MPPENSSYERKYKYPFISSEILALDLPWLLDLIFQDINISKSNSDSS